MDHRITISIASALIGAFILYWFFWPDITERIEVVETVKTDTVWVEYRDTVYLSRTEIKQQVIRDTVLIDYTPRIRSFSNDFNLLHGNVSVSGEVLGEVLKMSLASDLKFPTVTNTITRTETKTVTKDSKGLFASGYLDSDLKPSVGGQYLNREFIFSYQYRFSDKSHQIGVSKRLF